MRISLLSFSALIMMLALAGPVLAQKPNNDGFHRRNGQMHVLRNGQLRPMTRDSRLPTGTVVTKYGFLIAANGKRTELREGQACDLKGRVVAVKPVAGGLALGAPPKARSRNAGRPAAGELQNVLAEFFSGRRDEEQRYEGDDDKREEYEREQRKKEEEYYREGGKKWKEKRKKHKKWDD